MYLIYHFLEKTVYPSRPFSKIRPKASDTFVFVQYTYSTIVLTNVF